LSKPRPRVQRATGPRLLLDSPQPAGLVPTTSRSLVKQWWREAGGERAHAPGGTFRGGGGRHFKEDEKFPACVQLFKCFTALNIRPADVFCDVQNAPSSYSAGAPPHMHAGELPTLSSQLRPRARICGRTNVCPERHSTHRPSLRH